MGGVFCDTESRHPLNRHTAGIKSVACRPPHAWRRLPRFLRPRKCCRASLYLPDHLPPLPPPPSPRRRSPASHLRRHTTTTAQTRIRSTGGTIWTPFQRRALGGVCGPVTPAARPNGRARTRWRRRQGGQPARAGVLVDNRHPPPAWKGALSGVGRLVVHGNRCEPAAAAASPCSTRGGPHPPLLFHTAAATSARTATRTPARAHRRVHRPPAWPWTLHPHVQTLTVAVQTVRGTRGQRHRWSTLPLSPPPAPW